MNDALIVDASAVVDVLVDGPMGSAIRNRLRGNQLHAPAHIDVEVLSALGRLHRAGQLSEVQVARRLEVFEQMVVQRHPLVSLLSSAWSFRHNLRLADALYAALSDQLSLPIVTIDRGLVAAVTRAEHPLDA